MNCTVKIKALTWPDDRRFYKLDRFEIFPFQFHPFCALQHHYSGGRTKSSVQIHTRQTCRCSFKSLNCKRRSIEGHHRHHHNHPQELSFSVRSHGSRWSRLIFLAWVPVFSLSFFFCFFFCLSPLALFLPDCQSRSISSTESLPLIPFFFISVYITLLPRFLSPFVSWMDFWYFNYFFNIYTIS